MSELTRTEAQLLSDIAASLAGGIPITVGDIEIGAVEIKDGAADIRQTVLAASTAAAAGDKAAVVALHPSSPLPAGYGFDVVDGPATTNGAYSAGDVIGGYRTVPLARVNDEPIIVTGVQVIFKAAVQPNIRVILFGATPGAVLADNDAYSLTAANALCVRKSLSSLVLGAAYTTHGTPKSISLSPQPFVMSPISGGKTIGYYLVDDSGITLTSTADIQVRFSGVGV